MKIKELIAKIITAVFMIAAFILLIVGHSKLFEYKSQLVFSLVIILISMVAFIGMIFLNGKAKLFTLIPIILILFLMQNYTTFITTYIARNLSKNLVSSDYQTPLFTNTILSLALEIFYLTALVFALKDKKWANISMFVFYGLILVSILSSLNGLFTLCNNYTEEGGYYYTKEILVGFILIYFSFFFTIASQISYFAYPLIKNNEDSMTKACLLKNSDEAVEEEPKDNA